MQKKRTLNWIDAIIKKGPSPPPRELRRFGLLLGLFIAGVFGGLLPWVWGLAFVSWPWIAGALLVFWALAAPGTLAFVFHGWMILGGLLGWINTRIILGIVFYLVFFPVGSVMRLRGWDPLRRGWKRDLVSYRIPSKATDRKQMEKPF